MFTNRSRAQARVRHRAAGTTALWLLAILATAHGASAQEAAKASAQDGAAMQQPAPPAGGKAEITAPPVTVPEKPESLRDTIVASLKENPDIQIALARQDDAKYGVDEARAAYLPRVDLTLASGPEYNLPYTAPDNTMLRRSEGVLNLHQNIWDFGVTINDIKRARATYASAQWATRGQIEQISFDIASAYVNLLEKQKMVVLVQDEIAAQSKMSNMIKVQKDLGLTTTADVSRAQVRLDNLQQQLLDAQSQLQQQRESYRRLTGHLPNRAIDLPPVDRALPVSVAAAVELIEDHSPELAQAVQDRRSIDRQLASQNGNFFPKIGLDAQGNYKNEVLGRTGRNEDARVVVTLSYNIFRGGADLAIQRRIAARLREADYQLMRTRRDVEQDLRIDYQSLGAANEKMATIDSQVEAAEKVVTLFREQFRSGQRSVFDLLDSQQALFQARQNRLVNYTQKQVSGMRVLQKLGGLFALVSDGEALPPLVVPAPTTPRRS